MVHRSLWRRGSTDPEHVHPLHRQLPAAYEPYDASAAHEYGDVGVHVSVLASVSRGSPGLCSPAVPRLSTSVAAPSYECALPGAFGCLPSRRRVPQTVKTPNTHPRINSHSPQIQHPHLQWYRYKRSKTHSTHFDTEFVKTSMRSFWTMVPIGAGILCPIGTDTIRWYFVHKISGVWLKSL